jgi:glucose dehydrogenase
MAPSSGSGSPNANNPAPNNFGPTGTRRGVSVGDGKVYTTAAGKRVVALNKDTGALVWAVQPTFSRAARASGQTAKVGTMYYDGMVYLGTNDGNRGAGYAIRSCDGSFVWAFYGGAAPGVVVTDVNGQTFNAGASWGPPVNGQSCALTAGATPWMHPAIDPELNQVYWTFGNARSCGSSQDASTRPGDNLFSVSMVAVDAKTWRVQVALPVAAPWLSRHGQYPAADGW